MGRRLRQPGRPVPGRHRVRRRAAAEPDRGTQYRTAIAWQNTAYNQPPHPSFFIGDGMAQPAWPNVYTP
ncbi:hypothetical protein [Actinoallomurus iriomotensis]|uniref:rhamnogalacturonan lyase family protein n=1 Tax=Actinoallomurus iriomotensis TaxID=478107 RepID=UPI003D7FF877